MKRPGGHLLVLVWIVAAAVPLVWGLPYYRLAPVDRAYSPLHELFSPTGLVGHGLGVVGTLMLVVGVGTYSARKRVRSLRRLGHLSGWLDFHIFLCTLGPFLVVLHTGFRVTGIVAIAFWSMVVVVASGVFGRYVYARIPKTLNGQFLSLRELEARQGRLLEDIRARVGEEAAGSLSLSLPAVPERPGFVRAAFEAVRFDLRARGERRRMDRALKGRGLPEAVRGRVLGLAQERARLRQQMLLLGPFQRAFRYWHAFHLPLALVMLVVVTVHVAVAVVFGYTWIF
ncbi:MAG TPA: hypothetical protein VKB18_08820 [Gemmatimonadota bacterium]|nr:hypothetical protein [Gemmatimonadota bacterium]